MSIQFWFIGDRQVKETFTCLHCNGLGLTCTHCEGTGIAFTEQYGVHDISLCNANAKPLLTAFGIDNENYSGDIQPIDVLYHARSKEARTDFIGSIGELTQYEYEYYEYVLNDLAEQAAAASRINQSIQFG
jgi:hypothetical protein